MKIIKFLLVIFLFTISGCREDIIEFREEAKEGKLFVNSSPTGAEIFFENNKTGKITPDSLTNLQPGTYSLKLRLMGFDDEIVNVSLQSGQKRYINISFRGY